MLASVTWKEYFWIISYKGDTTGIMPGPLKEVQMALHRKAKNVLIDLSKLTYINRIGVRAVLETLNLTDSYKVNIFLVTPSPEILRILKLNGLSNKIPMYSDSQTAIRHIDTWDTTKRPLAENVDTLLICQKDLSIAGYLRNELQSHPAKSMFRVLIERELDNVLEIIFKEKIDCLILDSSLPMVKFDDFIEKLRSDMSIPNIPILVVTPEDKVSMAELMVRSGAHDIIRFPFDINEMYIRLLLLMCYVRMSKNANEPDVFGRPIAR